MAWSTQNITNTNNLITIRPTAHRLLLTWPSPPDLVDRPTQLICISDLYMSTDKYKRHSRFATQVYLTLLHCIARYCRLQRWSFFHNDGMVMFFFQGTIAIDGFSMVLPSLDHHHWMFFCRSTIEIDGFSMVFPNSGAMVSDGFDLEKDQKMRIIVTDILQELCLLFRIQITLLLVSFRCKSTLKYSVFF